MSARLMQCSVSSFVLLFYVAWASLESILLSAPDSSLPLQQDSSKWTSALFVQTSKEPLAVSAPVFLPRYETLKAINRSHCNIIIFFFFLLHCSNHILSSMWTSLSPSVCVPLQAAALWVGYKYLYTGNLSRQVRCTCSDEVMSLNPPVHLLKCLTLFHPIASDLLT